ncbi:hypothetical protein MAP00_005408 [Monascus purpureus]|nr:hypothetical protein MAP00_005408 [Monascus purpureus]
MSTIHIPSTGGKEPFWGPQTSKMNFCEEDYHFSSYTGEFINTVTSFSYVFFGGYGLYRQFKTGTRVEISHCLSYISLMIVGIGSTLFHASLKYPLQLVDDLSMLLGGGIMFHYFLTINSSTKVRFGLFSLITIVLSLAVWAHISSGDSALHQVVFGSMVVTVGFRTFSLLNRLIVDEALKSKLKQFGTIGYLTLIAAYVFWLVDVFACQPLRSLRHTIGLPSAWLFEFHGW